MTAPCPSCATCASWGDRARARRVPDVPAGYHVCQMMSRPDFEGESAPGPSRRGGPRIWTAPDARCRWYLPATEMRTYAAPLQWAPQI